MKLRMGRPEDEFENAGGSPEPICTTGAGSTCTNGTPQLECSIKRLYRIYPGICYCLMSFSLMLTFMQQKAKAHGRLLLSLHALSMASSVVGT